MGHPARSPTFRLPRCLQGSVSSVSLNQPRQRRAAARAASPAAGGAAQQQQQRRRRGLGLDVLAGIVGSNRGLLSLDISHTAVPVGPALAAALAQLTAGAPNATKPAHGLQQLRLAGCSPAAGGQQAAMLGRVLAECPALLKLDASGEAGAQRVCALPTHGRRRTDGAWPCP